MPACWNSSSSWARRWGSRSRVPRVPSVPSVPSVPRAGGISLVSRGTLLRGCPVGQGVSRTMSVIVSASEEAPPLQHMQRRIEATTHRGDGTGALQRGNSLSLHIRESAGLGLQLDRVAAALMDDEDIGDTGTRAESLEDGGLYWAALPTVG